MRSYNACISRGASPMLRGWHVRAEEAEIDLAETSIAQRGGGGNPSQRRNPKSTDGCTACFKCGKEGQWAAKCRSNRLTQKTTPGPPRSLPSHHHEPARQPWKVIEFIPSPRKGERTPTSPARGLGESNTDSDGDPHGK